MQYWKHRKREEMSFVRQMLENSFRETQKRPKHRLFRRTIGPHPIRSAPSTPRRPPAVSLSLSLFLSNDSARRAHTVMCFRTIRTHVVLHVIDRRFSARAGAVGGHSILTSLWTMVKLVVSVHPQGFCVASTGLAVSTQTPEVA